MTSSGDDGLVDSHIRRATGTITARNRWDHFLARIGWKRSSHLVEPRLYILGRPAPDSPVFISANYNLSFDALRSSVTGVDGYIMLLDTRGINVWCAAGKGAFGTDEVVHRIEATRLGDVVRCRTLIAPRLGAAGVAAHEVTKRSAFQVETARRGRRDLPEYIRTHEATPEMRQVRFGLGDRLPLIPVEAVRAHFPLTAIFILLASLFRSSWGFSAAGMVAAILAGVLLFPILLPWVPTPQLSTEGFIMCTGFAMCWTVCPHAVFASRDGTAELADPEARMEYGACQLNCPAQAIVVESGIGCATAMTVAPLNGKKEACC